MYQEDLYNEALNVGTDYTDKLDLSKYRLPAWQFSLIHSHTGAGATLTVTVQYSFDGFLWFDGKELLSAEAVGSAIIDVSEATINKLYVARFLRFKIEVGTANASNVFLSLGLA